MTVTRLGLTAWVVGSLVLQACGGGGSGPNPPPPPPPSPANLIKQAGDGQSAAPGQPVPVPPAVKVTSATGAPISGVAVTFAVVSGGGSVSGATPSTGTDGIATVGSWTLGAAAGPNTLTATIAGSGINGNPATFSATGQLTAFNPTANTSLSGTRSFSTVNIPAGVTVTMTGNLTLNATGAVTIAGSLVGDCVALTLNADGALTMSGTLSNGCTGAPASLPAITLVGKGGYTFNGAANVVAAGDVTITDDPTATDADFAPALLRRDGPPASIGVPCNYAVFSGSASPATAVPNGVAGSPNGVDGRDGSTWTLRCKGGGDINVGTLSLTGQHGGNGGDGTHSSTTAAVSKGGKGGKGGTVKIQTRGSLGIGTASITTGNGGNGGSANADGSSGQGGTAGASADATGGGGGAPGLFTATAGAGISIGGTLQIGKGGRGGNATAIGGNGHDAPACPPAAGGPATATAGAGGSTPDKTLTAGGSVIGGLAVSGGVPGDGGNAEATAGKGGKGAQTCKPGGNGGDPTARGGDGGNGDLRNLNGNKVANGGNGGSMKVTNARGGDGWSDCLAQPFEAGGVGGTGGTTRGNNGKGGTGLLPGAAGAITYNVVSDGGNGGAGLPPGAGGPAGGNSTTNNGPVVASSIDDSFKPGNAGAQCAGGGSVDLIIQNEEQATRPWTKVLSKIGSAARVSHAISLAGSVTLSVPTTPTPMDIIIQQAVGNDRRTLVYYLRSDDLLALGGGALSEKARGSITTTISGLPPNSQGVTYAGSVAQLWPQPNSSPFNVPLARVETGFNVVGGCTLYGATLEPQSALLGLATYANGGNYGCNFAGGGVKSYVNAPVTAGGLPMGTGLTISGGFALDRLRTQIYAKAFNAPTTNFYALNGADLPLNVLQWEAVSHATSTNFEQSSFFFRSPVNWMMTMPPALNNPTVNIASIFNTYYIFDIILATQAQYLEGWVADYTQANSFGGINQVVLLALPHYFGTSVPTTVVWSTPAENLLDVAYMPKLPGLVNGNIFGYGFPPLGVPQEGNTWNIGARLNIAF
ncbi:MAG TPA: hypothetical protein VGQ69_12400 [Gemmatimonadales bacterium]|nr:hypothetical protein [Gemmatimonadales bacterium]